MSHEVFGKNEASIQSCQGNPLASGLLMAKDGPISAHYAPFERVNPQARVVLVGITPGRVQAANALAAARAASLAPEFDTKVKACHGSCLVAPVLLHSIGLAFPGAALQILAMP